MKTFGSLITGPLFWKSTFKEEKEDLSYVIARHTRQKLLIDTGKRELPIKQHTFATLVFVDGLPRPIKPDEHNTNESMVCWSFLSILYDSLLN